MSDNSDEQTTQMPETQAEPKSQAETESHISAYGLLRKAVQLAREREQQERAARDKPGPHRSFWASQVCHDCARRAVYQRAKVEVTTPLTFRALCRFALGDLLEEWGRRLMAEAMRVERPGWEWHDDDQPDGRNWLVATMPKDQGDDLYARTDAVMVSPDGQWVPIEYKSIAARALRYGLPNDHHMRQLGLWLWLAELQGCPITPAGGRLVYIVKDDARIFEFGIALTNQLRAWIGRRVELLRHCWGEGPGKGGKMPPRPAHPHEKRPIWNPTQYWGCTQWVNKGAKGTPRFIPRCPWFATCWRGWLEEHDHVLLPDPEDEEPRFTY